MENTVSEFSQNNLFETSDSRTFVEVPSDEELQEIYQLFEKIKTDVKGGSVPRLLGPTHPGEDPRMFQLRCCYIHWIHFKTSIPNAPAIRATTIKDIMHWFNVNYSPISDGFDETHLGTKIGRAVIVYSAMNNGFEDMMKMLIVLAHPDNEPIKARNYLLKVLNQVPTAVEKGNWNVSTNVAYYPSQDEEMKVWLGKVSKCLSTFYTISPTLFSVTDHDSTDAYLALYTFILRMQALNIKFGLFWSSPEITREIIALRDVNPQLTSFSPNLYLNIDAYRAFKWTPQVALKAMSNPDHLIIPSLFEDISAETKAYSEWTMDLTEQDSKTEASTEDSVLDQLDQESVKELEGQDINGLENFIEDFWTTLKRLVSSHEDPYLLDLIQTASRMTVSRGSELATIISINLFRRKHQAHIGTQTMQPRTESDQSPVPGPSRPSEPVVVLEEQKVSRQPIFSEILSIEEAIKLLQEKINDKTLLKEKIENVVEEVRAYVKREGIYSPVGNPQVWADQILTKFEKPIWALGFPIEEVDGKYYSDMINFLNHVDESQSFNRWKSICPLNRLEEYLTGWGGVFSSILWKSTKEDNAFLVAGNIVFDALTDEKPDSGKHLRPYLVPDFRVLI